MANRLRLGVIGLGARWLRFEPALAALNQEVRVQAVHDPLSVRAAEAARRWRCDAVGGVVELVERDDLDAVVVLTGRLGMWPVCRAVLAGKPVYCAVSPLADEEHADADRQALPADARVFAALWPALDMQVRTVRKRVLPELGAAQLAQVAWRSGGRGGDPLSSPAVLALLGACAGLFDAGVLAVTAVAPRGQRDVLALLLEFKGGSSATLTLSQSGVGEPACRVDVQTGHGDVVLSLPRRLRWRSGDGTSTYTAPPGMAEYASLEAFVGKLRAGSDSVWEQGMFECLDWVRAARRSRDGGGRVRLGGGD